MVELLNATGETGKTAPGNLLHFVRVYYWTTVEWKELLPGSSLSHLDHGNRIHNLYLVFGIGNVAITISMVLLPCAVSSAWTCCGGPYMRHWFSTWKMAPFLGVVIADIFETKTASCNRPWWCNNVSAPTTCWGKQSTTKNEEVKNDSAEDLAFQQIKMDGRVKK